MKIKILPTFAAFALLAGNALALTPVKEPFNGKALDKSRWYEYRAGNGALAPNAGKLNLFTKGAATVDDFVSIELLNSKPGYNESWQLILDLSNKANAGKKVACGLMLFNDGDRDDYLFLEFYGKSGLTGGVITDLKHGKNHITLPKAVSKGSLRLRFDKKTKLLTLDLSATDKKQGYEWLTVGTFSPANDKKATVFAKWNMDPGAGRFGVQLFGFASDKTKVAKNKVTYDNFELSALP